MRRFCLTHGQNGTEVCLETIPWWADFAERAGEWAAEHLLPGHMLCCNIPDWAWELGWGEYDPKWETWEHSLGQLCWRFSCWVELGFGAWRQVQKSVSIPVTYEWVQEHFPEMGSPWTDGWKTEDETPCVDGTNDVTS